MYVIILMLFVKGHSQSKHSFNLSTVTAPVILMETDNEQLAIELHGTELSLQNTTFTYTHKSVPTCQNLNIQPTIFAKFFMAEANRYFRVYKSANFCPVYDWAPPLQPVHFYLSNSSLDLIIYGIHDKVNAIISQPIQTELCSNCTYNCFSLFPYQQSSFLVDCNMIGAQNKTIFIQYDMIYDPDDNFVVNFTINQTFYYIYQNNSYAEISECAVRVTETFPLLNQHSQIEIRLIQYCPKNKYIDQDYSNFLVLEMLSEQKNNTVLLSGYIGNSLNISAGTQFSPVSRAVYNKVRKIASIASNQAIKKFTEDTWNVLFLFEYEKGMYKCLFDYYSTWQCTYTIIELMEPDQVRTVQTVNSQLYFLTWTESIVLLVQLSKSVARNDYDVLFYREAYEEGYQIFDAAVTYHYLAVVLTNETSQNYTIRQFMCGTYLYPSNSTKSNTNILKIFQLTFDFREVFFESYIPINALFLNGLNYAQSGDFLIYFETNLTQAKIATLILNEKKIILNYKSLNGTSCFEDDNQLNVIVADIEIQGMLQRKQISLIQRLVICLLNPNNPNTYLVANKWNGFGILPLSECPRGDDTLNYYALTNSVNLLSEIVGPLLQFSYIPAPANNHYFPYYLDYVYEVQMKNKQQLKAQVKKIFRAVTFDVFEEKNNFGLFEMLVTLESNPSNVMLGSCQIKMPFNESLANLQNIQLELQDCNYRTVIEFQELEQVDYLKIVDEFYFGAQLNNSKIYLCFLVKCVPVTGVFTGQNLRQVEIQIGAQIGDYYYFRLTYLSEQNLTQIQFESLILDFSILGVLTHLSSEPIWVIDHKHDFQQFDFGRSSQEYMAAFTSASELFIYTLGPLNTTNQQIVEVFTWQSSREIIQQCAKMENKIAQGASITWLQEEKLNSKSVIIWCTNETNSRIIQYQMDSVTQVRYWRLLPLYGNVINSQAQVFISGDTLYAPIVSSKYGYVQYYVYNLLDYSPKMLVTRIDLPINKISSLATQTVNNLYDVPLLNDLISFALMITDQEFMLYFLNEHAKFIFTLREDFIYKENNSLIFLINQPISEVSMYRNYSVNYIFRDTKINTNASDHLVNITLTSENKDVVYISNYYIYLLLINMTIFHGPIIGYNYQASTSIPYIIPTPYLQLNKFLGRYMETINHFGLPAQIISLDNPLYASLFVNNYLLGSNAEQYKELVLVLTDQFLLFYQQTSNKSRNPFKSCERPAQVESELNCQIRLLHAEPLNVQKEASYCQIYPNNANQMIILCQDAQFTKSTLTKQVFMFIGFIYIQETSQITVNQVVQTFPEICYCYFYDMQPFSYKGDIYQVIKHNEFQSNSFLGIYLIVLDYDKLLNVTKILELPQPGQKPYQLARDFSLLVQANQLYIFLLQHYDILQQVIDLDTMTPLPVVNQVWNESIAPYQNKELTTIQVVNQTSNSSTQALLVGNHNILYEIVLDITRSDGFRVNHTFKQYQLCDTNFFQRPQFVAYDMYIMYIVTSCLTYEYEYTGIQSEIQYIFNQESSNLIYMSLFRRNASGNSSQPVQILEPYLIDSQNLHLFKFAIYVTDVENKSQPHLLVTNNSYFLIDYFIYSDQGYYIVYPVSEVNEAGSYVQINITAYNTFSSNYIVYDINWTHPSVPKSRFWSYLVLALIGTALLVMISYMVIGACKHSNSVKPKKLMINSIEKSGIELIVNKSEINDQIFESALSGISEKFH